MKPQSHPSRHLVIGLSGPELTPEEVFFLRRVQPVGVILFSRNIVTLRQVGELIHALRATADPPPTLWIDQEGGRVQRLRAPFTRFPSAFRFARLDRRDPERAGSLARLAGEVNALELAHMGIGVNCAPVLDIREAGADPVIGERAFGDTPETVVRLAGAWLDGFQGRGVLAMGKHFPGHGAAQVDSHKALPVIYRSPEELAQREFVPFRALQARLPAFMTAHLIAAGLDPDQPATWSRAVIQGVLRDGWGYTGLVVSDALEMGALSGSLSERASRAIQAGCDLLLCCTGHLPDAEATLEGVARGLEGLPAGERQGSGERVRAGLSGFRPEPGPLDTLPDGDRYRQARRELEAFADVEAEAGGADGADPTESMA